MSSNMENFTPLILLSTDRGELDDLIKYFRIKKDNDLSVLYSILGEKLLMYFDCMSGTTIKIPKREEVFKTVNYIKIYHYCKKRKFSNESYERAAKIFGRRVNQIRKLVKDIIETLKED